MQDDTRELDLQLTEARGIEFGQISSLSKATFSIPFTSDTELSSLHVYPIQCIVNN